VNASLMGAGLGDQRYALRACVEADLLPYGSPDASVSGGELLAAIRAADAYLESRPARAEP